MTLNMYTRTTRGFLQHCTCGSIISLKLTHALNNHPLYPRYFNDMEYDMNSLGGEHVCNI